MIVLLWAVTDSLMFDVGPFTCVSVCVGSYSHIGWWFDHLINWSTTPNTEHGLQVTVSLIHDSSKSTRSEWLTSFPLSPCHLFWCCSFELQASRRSSTMKYINTKEIFRVVGVTTVYEPAQIRLESCKIYQREIPHVHHGLHVLSWSTYHRYYHYQYYCVYVRHRRILMLQYFLHTRILRHCTTTR